MKLKKLPFLIRYVADRFKSHEMRDEAVDTLFLFDFVPDWCQTKNMYEKIVSGDFSILKYCHDRCKAQEMCDKTIDDFLPALKFAPDWVFTSEMIEKLQTDLFVDDNLLFF